MRKYSSNSKIIAIIQLNPLSNLDPVSEHTNYIADNEPNNINKKTVGGVTVKQKSPHLVQCYCPIREPTSPEQHPCCPGLPADAAPIPPEPSGCQPARCQRVPSGVWKATA